MIYATVSADWVLCREEMVERNTLLVREGADGTISLAAGMSGGGENDTALNLNLEVTLFQQQVLNESGPS